MDDSVVPPETVPLSPIAEWQPASGSEPTRSNSSHFFMYAPRLLDDADEHALRAVIRANQFPADPAACNRTLVLFDDALTAGLGYTARLMALSLLVAVQEKRVLINVPHSTARWCARAPHTLGCFYEPITHCPTPTNLTGAKKWSTRGSSMGLEARQRLGGQHVRISTSQVHRSLFWYGFHPPEPLFAATHDLLFRPRPWVREAARCTMRAASLRGGNFAVVHARYSVEKKKERGAKLPRLASYLRATQTLLEHANASRVFLQTSTPEAVDLFENWSTAHDWSLSYTQNERSINDPWMGGKGQKEEYVAAGERTSAVAQSINALIASRSRHFLSPSSSMWTSFIRALMGRRVGDRVFHGGDDSNIELLHECQVVWHNIHNLMGSGGVNVSKAERDRCRRTNYTLLLEIHRKPLRHDEIESSV